MNSAAIVIPNYNGESFIMETIRLLVAGLPEIPIVVIDDFSTDNSVLLLRSNGIKVVQRSANGGFAAAVNTGLRHLQSSQIGYALVCNSDLVPGKDECSCICSVLDYLESDPTIAVVGFRERNDVKSELCAPSDISGFLFWLRIDILARVGFLDERFYMYGEETDFFRRVIASDYKIIQSGVYVSHATEKSGKSKMMNSWYAIRNCLFLEIKRNKPVEALKKSAALLLIMFGLLGDRDDPSSKRVRRPGIVFGPLMLLMAIFWNIFYLVKMNVNREFR